MKLLIAVDGSEQALEAVRHALKLHRAGLKATFILATMQAPAYPIETILAPPQEPSKR